MCDVLAAGPVAFFASHVPFRHLLGSDVVVNRVASVASRASRSLPVIGRIKRFPPVSSLGNKIGTPHAVGNVPLRGLGKVIISYLGEVALLPKAAVNQRDIILSKVGDGI